MRDNIENQPFGNFIWFMGVVEDIDDPLKINRVRVRCIGFHSDNRSEVATDDLPWAPMLNSTANMSAPMLNQGDWVVGFFIDGATAQQPVVLGSITGIPTGPADSNKGFYDPDGIFPRSGQITRGTNSPLARGELGIPTGVEAQPSYYEPPAPLPGETTPTETPPPPAENSISGGSYIGDSIAVGIGTAAKQTVNATVGMNSTNILKNYSGKSGSSYTVISAGTNDQSGEPTESNLRKLRASINSPKVVFVVPFTKQQNGKPTAAVIANMQKAAKAVRKVAAEKGDIIFELDNYKTNDGLHPNGYGTVAKAIEQLVGKTPSPGASKPATDTTPTPPATNNPSNANFNEHEQAIIASAKKFGITEIPELAALLANCKAETSWRTFQENLSYSSVERIKAIFPKYFKGIDVTPYVKNPEKLASRVYANRNGNGNEASKEGYKYRGRGYLQITGKSNYNGIKNRFGTDFVSNPDLVNSSIQIRADTSAWWWATYVKNSRAYKKPIPPNESDTYIIACGGIVNGKVPSNGQHERIQYFREYLNKLRGTVIATDAVIETVADTGEIVSVTQPNYKTPSRQTDEDAITYTRRTAAVGILTSSGLTWNEPVSKFSAMYPKNHVLETAGGHVLEFDDTEGSERIHIFHKTGSFIEIHPDGRIVMRSNGSMNQITYGDGNFYIRGNCNISATGDINLLSNKSTNLSTMGDVNWKVGGNFNLTAQGEAKVVTGKLFLEGSEIRMNEGTAGIGAPAAVAELSVSGESAEILQSGEGYEANSRGVLSGNGESEDQTPYTTDSPGTVPQAGGSTDVKPTTVEWKGDLNIQISKYYKLKDLVKGTPIRGSRGITATDVVNNLTIIAQVILDPLRDAGLKFHINDGLRDPLSSTGQKNPKSDHIVGCAVDLGPSGMSAYDQALKIHEIVGNRARQHLLEYTDKGAIGWNHIAIGKFGAKNPNGEKSGLPVATFYNHKNVHAPNTFKDYKNGRKG